MRCPACGWDRHPKFLGIHQDAFELQAYPKHRLERIVRVFGGRGSLSVEKRPLGLELATALFQALSVALTRLGESLRAAGVEPPPLPVELIREDPTVKQLQKSA